MGDLGGFGMLGARLLVGSIAAAAYLALVATAQSVPAPVMPIVGAPVTAPMTNVVPVKLGFGYMSKAETADLWKRVDEYATVDALQEFCGKKLNLQRRAWRAVSACIEVPALRKVLGVFNQKKADYLKAWQTIHGEEERKKAVCERFKTKLVEYSKIISGQLSEAATMCRNCLFC
jgi:hypothetical protein